jgi:hypothetical protein
MAWQPTEPSKAEGARTIETSAAPSEPALEAPSYWVPPAPEKVAVTRPLWRRLLRWVIPAFVILGFLGNVIFSASRSSSGEISRSGDLFWSELRVGDCFDDKNLDSKTMSEVTARPCSDEHEYEVIHIGALPDGAYPGDEATNAYFDTKCAPDFMAYVGMDYQQSGLQILWVAPDEEAWRKDTRTVLCAAYDPRTPRLTGSLRGSKR